MERIPAWVRFWSKVDKTDSCWLWTAFKNPCGYGMFGAQTPERPKRVMLAHRWAYEQCVGPIPAGMELDHLCRIRACVNFDHLRVVPHSENIPHGILRGLGRTNKAKTHCPQGHPYDVANTYIDPRGGRKCRICNADRGRALRHRLSILANNATLA